MTAGRPKIADAGVVYSFAHQFYWDFRRLSEGSYRWHTNKKKARELDARVDREEIELTAQQKSSVARVVEEEIRDGRLKASGREARKREIEEATLSATREMHRIDAGELARKRLKLPGEPEVLESLLQAKTPKQIRQICKDSKNWSISMGSVLPTHLSQHASEFIAAKDDSRFPQSTIRPTSRLKQLWFLSRALAGAVFGYRTRSAINLVGSIRPEQTFEDSRSAKPSRERVKSRSKS
jgi:hypothetical protein